MTIKDQHLKAIKENFGGHLEYHESSALACERITLERMKGFAEWIGKTGFEFLPANEVWIGEVDDTFYTTTDLVKLYTLNH